MIVAKNDMQLQSGHVLNESTQIMKKEVRESGVLFNAQFIQASSDLSGVSQASSTSEAESIQDTKTKLFNVLFAAITGKEYVPNSPELACDCVDSSAPVGGWEGGRVQRSAVTQGLGGMAWESVEVTLTQRYERTETTNFSATGTIETLDGHVFDVDVSLQMHNQQSYQFDSVEKQTVVFKDPLVLNFDGGAVELSDETFSFDIDHDGVSDLMPYLVSGSGWLAYDKNNDGQINDGSELFGAISGNGFDDLLQYDEDNNGFIDEADSVFDSLQLWKKTEAGDELTSLLGSDVGAIGLASSSTPFMQYNDNGAVAAAVRETGVFLKESGGVGLVQQVDIANKEVSEEAIS
ncbi:hypothetical protein [Neptunomonas phycophila]|uniref:hypothetical protein n=1 Tax=Neptunomonas phycophila TaxID=1572645 RepID=UPI0009489596|nr:hypothetical protein [Neptunomonas phycophila]